MIRWSAAIRMRRSASQKTVSEGLWPGRYWTSRVLSRSSSSSPSRSGLGHLDLRTPGAEAAGDLAQRVDDVPGDAAPQHQLRGLLVVALGVLAEVLDEGDGHVDRGHLGAGPVGHDLGQPQVVDVLVGEHDELDVLDPVPERFELALELVQRLGGVGPGVDQGQRVVLQQVAVDPPHLEGRRDPEHLDPGVRDALPDAVRDGLAVRRHLAHDRIRASSSSRFPAMSSGETRDSRLRRSSGSVFDGRTLKCQSG